MKLVMLRAAIEFDRRRDTTRSAEMANKYFESFPNMNFPYDAGIMPFINILISAKKYDDAIKHLRILAQESKQYIDFYESQSSQDVFQSFRQDYEYRLSAVSDVLQASGEVQNDAFKKEMEDMLGPLLKSSVPEKK